MNTPVELGNSVERNRGWCSTGSNMTRWLRAYLDYHTHLTQRHDEVEESGSPTCRYAGQNTVVERQSIG